MKPIHYNIHLEPNLETFVFQGTVTIDIDLETPTSQIVVNAKNLDIPVCKYGSGNSLENAPFIMDKKKEEITITLPTDTAQEGRKILYFEFSGELNDMLLGFYRSKYVVDGQTKYAATTQFEEREARAAFPCFDEPALKATFDIEYLIENHLSGVANTAISEEIPTENGKKLVKFDRTPIMSTYLLYFGIGEFEFKEDTSKLPTLRTITTPGKVHLTDFALDWARKSMDFGEEYTGFPFPISKCDFIGMADFAFGAMENFGAQVYREVLLLVHPGKTPKAIINRIAAVIAHETAHMWFGDLVSPADWKYIWLNESFASYFTYAIPDHYQPEWGVWDNFIQQTYRGMNRDSFIFTVPIELPGDQEIHIDASSAPIIYNKGAAVIRILNGFLGEEKFKKSVQYFMKKYQFGVATTEQYWEAFEEASGEPITEFADSWIHQEGFPIVSVHRDENTLNLSQERFTYLPNDSTQTWLIPIKILLIMKDGSIQTKDIIFKTKTIQVDIPADTVAYKLNAEQTGFFRVNYSDDDWKLLGTLVKEKSAALPAIESFGLENDYFNLVKRGDLTIEHYLAFLENYYLDIEGYLPLDSIVENLTKYLHLIPNHASRIEEVGRKIFEPALEKFGLEPKEDDSMQTAELRNSLIWAAFKCKSDKITAFGTQKFNELLEDKDVHADIYSSIVKIGGSVNPKAFDFFKQQILDPNVPATQKMSILTAMGNLPKREQLEEALEFNLVDVPKNNRMYILMSVSTNPVAKEWMWDYYKNTFPRLLTELPLNILGQTLASVVPACGYDKLEEVKPFLETIAQQKPMAENTVKMALEIIEIFRKITKW